MNVILFENALFDISSNDDSLILEVLFIIIFYLTRSKVESSDSKREQVQG